MADEVRKRAACDRCHSQKTKCPRQPGQEVCDRCLKAKAACIFSPFRQKKVQDGSSGVGLPVAEICEGGPYDPDEARESVKRKRLTSETVNQNRANFENNIPLDHPGMDFNFDWLSQTLSIPEESISNGDMNVIGLGNQESFMSFDFGGGAISNAIENLGQPNIISNMDDRSDQAHSLKTTPALLMGADDSSSPAISINSSPSDYYWGYPPQAVDSDASSQCVRKLSQLSIDLYEHWKTVPPQAIHDPLSAENQAKWISGIGCKGFELEDTFRFTQAMIEIYPSFLSMFSSQRTEKTNEPIDHSSVLLLLSCHLRLITVYEELFKHGQICINQKGRAKTLQQAMLNGPRLMIGTYVPPPSSAIPMQMLLFMQFATQLFDFAADLASQIKDPGAATPSSGSSSSASSSSGSPEDPTLALTKAAAENVKTRALSMSQQLSALRTQFLSAGILA